MNKSYFMIIALGSFLLCPIVTVPSQAAESVDLTTLPLESLLDMTVTSVSKRSQAVMDAAAAVFIVTSDDIKRSGATSVPEVLRMVPGLEVARIDANNWAITSRGFNGRFANKLLVLLDGRSVYNNVHSGVFWDNVDTLLEDIDRIEVIRGPGAALWGANAVNGIINIISKPGTKTLGSFAQAGIGTEEGMFAAARQGISLGESSTARLFAKYQKQNGMIDTPGFGGVDRSEQFSSGFRLDSTPSLDDSLSFSGDISYREDGMVISNTLPSSPYYQTETSRSFDTFSSLVGRFEHRFSDASQLSAQLSYEYNHVSSITGFLPGDRHVLDFDTQYSLSPNARHALTWGAGYRLTHDRYKSGATISITPENSTEQLVSLFIHDDILLIPERLHLVLGAKLEHNSYTGLEVQPSARILWSPDSQRSLWASISRAVRTPSRGETSVSIQSWTPVPISPPIITMLPTFLHANDQFKSETVLAHEIGYRQQLNDRFFYDLALFYNRYNNLRTLDPTLQPTRIDISIGNSMKADSYGLELSAEWQPTTWLRLQAAYTSLWLDMRLKPASTDRTATAAEELAPRHQLSLRSSFNLGPTLSLDTWLRYVDGITALNSDGVSFSRIDPYLTADIRVAWHPTRNIELALVGRNLVEPSHKEFITEVLTTTSTDIQRSIYGLVTWRY